MVPASLRNKQRQGAAMVKKQKKNLFGLAPRHPASGKVCRSK